MAGGFDIFCAFEVQVDVLILIYILFYYDNTIEQQTRIFHWEGVSDGFRFFFACMGRLLT